MNNILSHCCQKMKDQVEHQCDKCSSSFECPDCFVSYSEHGFGLIVHDGGTSSIKINYCPWCGTQIG